MSKEAKPYWKQLLDPRWQKKRLEILDRDQFTCCDCGDNTQPLHVHHSFYRKGMMPWEYPSKSLHTLCEECHQHRADAEAELLTELSGIGTHALCEITSRLQFVKSKGATRSDVTEAISCALENMVPVQPVEVK